MSSTVGNAIKVIVNYARNLVLDSDAESRNLMRLLRLFVRQESKIVDVGCGYGRNLKLLLDAGYEHSMGVDVNINIVKRNRERGFRCATADEFNQSTEKFDAILMSHVIEHFPPAELKDFIDGYLDRLVPGGHLIIVTPLMSHYFYDDFDHVKPYQPMGIQLVFGGNDAQVQYYARNRLTLRDLWFRKSYYHFNFYRSRFINTPATRLLRLATFISALAFLLSNRLIGRKDGWIGVYQKIHSGAGTAEG